MRSILLCLCVLVVATGSAAADTLNLSEITSSAGVIVAGDVHAQGLHLYSPNIPNPLNATLTGTYASSYAQSDIDLAWADSFATFLVQSQQVAGGLASNTVNTGASGTLSLSVTEPMPLHIDSAWSYSLPADFMMSHMAVGVRAADSSDYLFIQEYWPETIPGEPASGTLTIQGDVTLTPGHTWLLRYNLSLEADAGPNYSATGNGFVNFTISPEPSTLAILAPLLFVLPHRKMRAWLHRP